MGTCHSAVGAEAEQSFANKNAKARAERVGGGLDYGARGPELEVITSQ